MRSYHLRAIKTPQMNDLTKMMNKTITEKVKSMLCHSKLPKSLWGEALRIVVDLINTFSSRPLNGEIPHEVWTRNKSFYGHLRVFGYKAYIYIPKDEKVKPDAKTKECIHIGSPRDLALYYGTFPTRRLFEVWCSLKIGRFKILRRWRIQNIRRFVSW